MAKDTVIDCFMAVCVTTVKNHFQNAIRMTIDQICAVLRYEKRLYVIVDRLVK
jgi:hypothetical protein